tara:strand:+ start:3438 stop:4490 length:1053 start_codon:yes stop_codon:yes gene_type:complete
MKVKIKSKRTFGVEVEFNNRSRYEGQSNSDNSLAQKLQSMTGQEVKFERYTHDNNSGRTWWRITTDGSSDLELVSPVMGRYETPQESMTDRCKVMWEALQSIDGISIGVREGIHVHIGCRDLDSRQAVNVLKLYQKHEQEIDSVMAPSRRGVHGGQGYAKSNLRDIYFGEGRLRNRWDGNTTGNQVTKRTMQYYWERLNKFIVEDDYENRFSNISQIARWQQRTDGNEGRYRKVNFCSYLDYRTIEFRQHGSSIDYEKIGTWVAFLGNLVDRAAKAKQVQISRAGGVGTGTVVQHPNYVHISEEDNRKNYIGIFGVGQSRKILKYMTERAERFGFNTGGAYEYATAQRIV